MTGYFITLEGGEGVGKSTQARLLADWLREQGRDVVLTREPGGCEEAEDIRKLAFNGREWSGSTMYHLMLAARHEHVRAKIGPALSEGHVVVCDRYVDSTTVYQSFAVNGYWLGVNRDQRCLFWMPDLTLLLDAPTNVTRKRLAFRTGEKNIFDRKGEDFHEKVRDGFLCLRQEHPDRIAVVDATQDVDTVQDNIRAIVKGRLARHKGAA